MKLPMLRGLARPTVAFVALACFSTLPALAQDCWLPDAFEPNDLVPTPIGPGLHADLALNGDGLMITRDVDRFLITIPPLQRVTLDFVYTPVLHNLTLEELHPIRGQFRALDGSGELRGYTAAGAGPDGSAFFDNRNLFPLDVEVTAQFTVGSSPGCHGYDLNVSLSTRPCDVLPDDALEGPDNCSTATVLQPGLHEDLIVFNEWRAFGRDLDYYRILDVQPGSAFRLHAFGPDAVPTPLRMEVFENQTCSGMSSTSLTQDFRNDGAAPRDYFVRVWTEETTGFSEYSLHLDYLPCDMAMLDRFEPNDACGSFTPLVAGYPQALYDDLSLESGDVDGFEIVVPPGFTMGVSANAYAVGAELRVHGVSAPACPTAGGPNPSGYTWKNRSTSAVTQRFVVYAAPGFCGRYYLYTDMDAHPCSAAELGRNEPNEDCSTATAIEMRLDSSQQVRQTSWTTALSDGDVDCFRVVVPAGQLLRVTLQDYFDSWPTNDVPALELLALPGGDCSASPLRCAMPRLGPGADTFWPREMYLLLPNRLPVDLEYVLQLSSPDVMADCRSYLMWIDPYEASWVPNPSTTDSDCADAIPLREGLFIRGSLAPGVPVRGSLAVEPGETVTASLRAREIRNLGAEVRLQLHAGLGDCEAQGASLGSVTVDPLDLFLPGTAESIPLAYTNQTGTAQRVIVECALGAQASNSISSFLIDIETDTPRIFSSSCAPPLSDPSTLRCPCANEDVTAQHYVGCRNSSGTGARLFAEGSNQHVDDALTVRLSGLPPSSAGIVFSGYSSSWMQFFDGILCIGPGAQPLWSMTADSVGEWTAPSPLGSALGFPIYPTTLQVWYRDLGGPCGSGSNLTNTIRIDWE